MAASRLDLPGLLLGSLGLGAALRFLRPRRAAPEPPAPADLGAP